MTILFESIMIKNLELKNRFVRSATGDRSADINGHVTDKQKKLFESLADGGVALIITGITYVHSTGQIGPSQGSIASDDCVSGYKDLTNIFHKRSAKIAIQLFHAGREAARFANPKGRKAIAPSIFPENCFSESECRSMDEKEILTIIKSFGDGARRAREAGFDAVQVHAGHGYLPSQFLSTSTNRRNDRWGGILENRLRFHKEIYKDIRKKTGKDYPIFIKLGVKDEVARGLQLSEGLTTAQILAQSGYDAIEVTQGIRGKSYERMEFRPKINTVDLEAYFREWCKKVKSVVNIPVMMVGGLRTFSLMEEIVEKGEADLISMSRPLIREPGIINEWRQGSRRKPACISCNKCLEELRKGVPLNCVQVKMRGSSHLK